MDISISDVLSVVAIGISLYTATILAKSRTQKDFFIQECRGLKDQYRNFALKLRRGELNAEVIKDELKYFSVRIDSLQSILKKEYKAISDDLHHSHSDFQWEVTMLDSLQLNYNSGTVHFTDEEKNTIMIFHEKVDKAIMILVVCINKA